MISLGLTSAKLFSSEANKLIAKAIKFAAQNKTRKQTRVNIIH